TRRGAKGRHGATTGGVKNWGGSKKNSLRGKPTRESRGPGRGCCRRVAKDCPRKKGTRRGEGPRGGDGPQSPPGRAPSPAGCASGSPVPWNGSRTNWDWTGSGRKHDARTYRRSEHFPGPERALNPQARRPGWGRLCLKICRYTTVPEPPEVLPEEQ